MLARPHALAAAVLASLSACAPPGPVTAPTVPPPPAADDAGLPALDAATPDDAGANSAPTSASQGDAAASAPAAPRRASPFPDAGAAPQFRACRQTSDCVAVPAVGCCHNGVLEAVAVAQKDAYLRSFTCPTPNPICPMYILIDKRTAECDASTHLCTMVAH